MKVFAAILGLMLVSGLPQGFAAQPATKSLNDKADACLRPFVQAGQFSGTVLVAKNGKPLFQKAYGLANREWNIPNTLGTKIRIGSLTKEFTAAAILQLQEAGKLSVDDPVSKYYPDAPAAWKDITVKHLLTHSSGIPDYTDIPHIFENQIRLDRTPEEIVKLTQDKPLLFEPGSRFSYDNSGYVLLGYIIEKVSGEHYADYIQRHIFDPLGMKSSGYDLSETVIPNRATGYDRVKGKIVNSAYISMTEPFSAGSLYSTVGDMLIWDQALYARKLLAPASFDAMFKDYGHHYGFGLFIDDQFGRPRIWHSGGINGFVTVFYRYPKDRLTVIVFSNIESAPIGRITNRLAAIYLNVPPRTAVAGGQALLKQTIDSLRAGNPNFDQMSADLADATRLQLPELQKKVSDLGGIQSIALIGAEPEGTDRYKVVFQKATMEWDIMQDKDGKLTKSSLRPLE